MKLVAHAADVLCAILLAADSSHSQSQPGLSQTEVWTRCAAQLVATLLAVDVASWKQCAPEVVSILNVLNALAHQVTTHHNDSATTSHKQLIV